MQIQEKEKRIISKVFIFFVVFVVIPNLVSNYVTRYSYDGRNVQKKLQREERDLNVQLESIEDARVKFRKNDVSYRQWREKGAVSKDTRQDPVEWIKMMGQIKKDRRLNVVGLNLATVLPYRRNLPRIPRGARRRLIFWKWNFPCQCCMTWTCSCLLKN